MYAYNTYKYNIQDLKNYNNEFTKYENTEIVGTEIATILNKAVNNNEQNNVNKDEQGMYIENDENSIKIDIYIKDNDTTYSMEKIYNMGVEKFINSFFWFICKIFVLFFVGTKHRAPTMSDIY